MSFKDYIKETSIPLLGIRELRDNLELEDIQQNPNWHWIIQAGIKNAIIGKKGNKLIWYDGQWVFGEWKSKFAIWKKGIWRGGYDEKGDVHLEGDSPNKW